MCALLIKKRFSVSWEALNGMVNFNEDMLFAAKAVQAVENCLLCRGKGVPLP